VQWKAFYEPFGTATVTNTGNIVQDLRFPGQVADSETGLTYNAARYYSPITGAYIQAERLDILQSGTTNNYTYAASNPFRFTDTMGLAACPDYAPDCIKPSYPDVWAIGAFSGSSEFAAIARAIYLGLNLPLAPYSSGLPPEGLLPPVENADQCTIGPATRARAGQSLWDPNGGEWRYDPGDDWHNPHWDYNPWTHPYSPWQNVPIKGLPPVK